MLIKWALFSINPFVLEPWLSSDMMRISLVCPSQRGFDKLTKQHFCAALNALEPSCVMSVGAQDNVQSGPSIPPCMQHVILSVLRPSYVADGKCLNESSKRGVMKVTLFPGEQNEFLFDSCSSGPRVTLIQDSFLSSYSNTFRQWHKRVRETTKSCVACMGLYWALRAASLCSIIPRGEIPQWYEFPMLRVHWRFFRANFSLMEWIDKWAFVSMVLMTKPLLRVD